MYGRCDDVGRVHEIPAHSVTWRNVGIPFRAAILESAWTCDPLDLPIVGHRGRVDDGGAIDRGETAITSLEPRVIVHDCVPHKDPRSGGMWGGRVQRRAAAAESSRRIQVRRPTRVRRTAKA